MIITSIDQAPDHLKPGTDLQFGDFIIYRTHGLYENEPPKYYLCKHKYNIKHNLHWLGKDGILSPYHDYYDNFYYDTLEECFENIYVFLLEKQNAPVSPRDE